MFQCWTLANRLRLRVAIFIRIVYARSNHWAHTVLYYTSVVLPLSNGFNPHAHDMVFPRKSAGLNFYHQFG